MSDTSTHRGGLLLLVLLSSGLASPPAAADNYPRKPDVDALHYTFRLTLRDASDEIARLLEKGFARLLG